MLNKTLVMQGLYTMPEKFTMDDLVDQLTFLQKIQKGLAQSEEDNFYTIEQALEIVKEWSK